MRRKRRNEDEYADYYDEGSQLPAPRERVARPLPRLPLHLFVISAIGCGFLVLVWLVSGATMLEKTLQALVAPCGLLWLGLFVCLYFALIAKKGFLSLVALACWLTLTFCGNQLVANWLAGIIERDYLQFKWEDLQPLDVALVLGGGTSLDPAGYPQLGTSGDRIRMAALLHHAKKVKIIVCSGTHGVPPTTPEPTSAEKSATLLTQLGVPQEQIALLGGKNTHEEILQLKQWLQRPESSAERVGIITSAWHMNRATRLADNAGVQVVPVPTNFFSREFRQHPNILIPSSSHLEQTTLILKEWLAALVGR